MAAAPAASSEFERDVVVIGGCGHVGLPLAIAFADRGAQVGIYDVSETAVETVNAGKLPFDEPGAAAVLERAVAVRAAARLDRPGRRRHGRARRRGDRHAGRRAPEPRPDGDPEGAGRLRADLRDGQLLVLRCTVYPGVTALVEKMIAGLGVEIEVAFCPERIAEGKAMTELFELPQIVSARIAAGPGARGPSCSAC